ncbi:MAG TPA: hypothetical protein VFG55_00415 [Rhodanobacteraceae bacterium]|nr:hypothetical protein [Rhodanobacteraceae bacterium]
MNATKRCLLLGTLALASPAGAQSFSCPQSGHPGALGGPYNAFLALDPPIPDVTQKVTLVAGQSGFTQSGLAIQRLDHRIDVFLFDLGGGFDPPPYNCLSTTLDPLPAGFYDVRLFAVPAAVDQAPVAIATTSFDVEPHEGGAEGPLPVTGLMSSNWFDPAHSGEGIIVQVAAHPPAPGTDGIISREFVFDWFTFDTDGEPFWISGNATIDPADPTHITVPGGYSIHGGFAGAFGANAMQLGWGTLIFSFPDLDHMTVEYDTGPSFGFNPPPYLANAPGGSGTLHYQRLLNIDGLNCDPRAPDCIR